MKKGWLSISIIAVLGLATSRTEAANFSLQGTLNDTSLPGASELFQALENGSIDGSYTVPDGSLPAPPGTSFGLSAFNVNLRDPAGNIAINYNSETSPDTGGFFSLFFGPDSIQDIFVFNDVKTQFQFDVRHPFDGNGPSLTGGVFGVGDGPEGEIRLASLTSTLIPDATPTSVPEPTTGIGLLTIGGALLLYFGQSPIKGR